MEKEMEFRECPGCFRKIHAESFPVECPRCHFDKYYGPIVNGYILDPEYLHRNGYCSVKVCNVCSEREHAEWMAFNKKYEGLLKDLVAQYERGEITYDEGNRKFEEVTGEEKRALFKYVRPKYLETDPDLKK
jgi:hypothetical protein